MFRQLGKEVVQLQGKLLNREHLRMKDGASYFLSVFGAYFGDSKSDDDVKTVAPIAPPAKQAGQLAEAQPPIECRSYY